MRTRLVADLHAPAAARRFAREQLESLAPHARAVVDEVALIVSELVTNAVRAGADAVDVDVNVTDERVDLQVSDDAPGWPQQRTATTDDPDGRGLAIVDELADRWRTVASPSGKSVLVTRSLVDPS